MRSPQDLTYMLQNMPLPLVLKNGNVGVISEQGTSLSAPFLAPTELASLIATANQLNTRLTQFEMYKVTFQRVMTEWDGRMTELRNLNANHEIMTETERRYTQTMERFMDTLSDMKDLMSRPFTPEETIAKLRELLAKV